MAGKRRVAAWLREVALAEGRSCGDLAFVFCSDGALLEMNRSFLGHDYFTDVITFDYSGGDHAQQGSSMPGVNHTADVGTRVPSAGNPCFQPISGDIFISVDTVAANAAKFAISARNEMLRVMVHGVLHLCGHGDKTTTEEIRMHALEDKYLELLEALNIPRAGLAVTAGVLDFPVIPAAPVIPASSVAPASPVTIASPSPFAIPAASADSADPASLVSHHTPVSPTTSASPSAPTPSATTAKR